MQIHTTYSTLIRSDNVQCGSLLIFIFINKTVTVLKQLGLFRGIDKTSNPFPLRV
jgi:hypothetical protein